MKIFEGRCTLVALGLGVVVFVFRILKLLILLQVDQTPHYIPIKRPQPDFLFEGLRRDHPEPRTTSREATQLTKIVPDNSELSLGVPSQYHLPLLQTIER